MKNLLLIPLALILLTIFGVSGFFYSMFVTKSHSKYFRAIAESLDQLGNTICQDLFNQWMLKGDDWAYLFGNIDETVSSVLGKNKQRETLTASGRWLDRLLNTLDKNHSIDAIEKNP